MANAHKENVIRIDTDNYTLDGPLEIAAIKFVAGTGSPSAAIKADKSSSGTSLWETASTTEICEQVCIRSKDGIHVDIAGTGSILYLYLK